MEIIGLVLGIVALAVGLYHVLEIKHALSNLKAVQSSISTQYLGEFPRFLKDIVDLINGARQSLVIFCDYPGYGEFSDPAKTLEYQHALERKKQERVNISFICLDAETRKNNINDQFAGQEWVDWINDEEKREKILKFLRSNTDRKDPQNATIADVVEALHELDEQILKGHYLKPDQQIKLHMPIYFWIADQQKAIFTIPTVGRSFEHGFLTSDHALIQALLEMYKRYTKAAIAASPTGKSEPSQKRAPDALAGAGGGKDNGSAHVG